MNRSQVITLLVTLTAVTIYYNIQYQSLPAVESLAVVAVREAAGAEVRVGEFAGTENTNDDELTYVGREVCRECHQENYALHSMHGHAHTFTMASDPDIASKFQGREFDYGSPFGRYKYDVDEDGLFVTLPDEGIEPFRLEYALGSGHNAITLFSLAADTEEGTVGYEHRGSWFHRGDQLGRTPGQPLAIPETDGEKYGMKLVGNVMERCVYCHTTTGSIQDQQIINLTANVNCEKCHGPGSQHVRQARASKTPPPYSVGKSDWDSESEIQLCGDCHRLPAAISRKELREYPEGLTRFQPVGLLRSKCFIESNGQLRCTTCHNPHETIRAGTEQQYVDNCRECHQQENSLHVVCPVSPTEGCIECHMPRHDIETLGTGFHDHWIRVHPED